MKSIKSIKEKNNFVRRQRLFLFDFLFEWDTLCPEIIFLPVISQILDIRIFIKIFSKRTANFGIIIEIIKLYEKKYESL